MSAKQQALDAHLANPNWTSSDIAHAIGLSPSTVRGMFSKMRITLPSEHLKRQRVREAIAGKPRKPFKRVPYAGRERQGEW